MKRRVKGWAKRKFVYPLQQALKQGISIEKLAISLALGITLGLIPFYGITTLLVGVVAISLRLNFIAMQLAHYLVHPIQIALILPFFKMGSTVIQGHAVNFTVSEYISLFKSDFFGALQELWKVNLSAIAIWLILSVPLSFLLYYVLKRTILKYRLRLSYVRA